MNENIDLTKILKDCPKGTKLYSSVHGEVSFIRITDEFSFHPIKVLLDNGMNRGYSANGKFDNICNGECVLFPSEHQRDWNKFSAPWYKKEKFDPETLKPFEKVLVRDKGSHHWRCDFYSHQTKAEVDTTYRYTTVGNFYARCIPYNDDTKHLVGTKDEAPEYYRYWED